MDARTSRFVWSRWLLVLVAVVSAAFGCQSAAAGDGPAIAGNRWTTRLPGCPCRQPQVAAVGDGWAVDRSSSLHQHPGAAACFRSYPPVRTEAGRSGQQCCYDRTEALVTSGSAAGTPDRATSCRGETNDGRMKVRVLGFVAHVLKDVRPWAPRYKSWRNYHPWWPPDNANACPDLHVEVQEQGAVFAWKEIPDTGGWEAAQRKETGSRAPLEETTAIERTVLDRGGES